MAKTLTAMDIAGRCRGLKKDWATRSGKFKDWYDILRLEDVLKQDNMESVTSNDPRTGFNLGRHLLVTAVKAHKVVQDDLTPEEVAATSKFEVFIDNVWKEHDDRYRKIGKQGFLWNLISWMLTTGWYSVFSIVEQTPDGDKLWSEVWSPADTFPNFTDDGMTEVAHIYTMSAAAANRKIKMKGWPQLKILGNITVYDYWFFDDNGDVANSIVFGNDFVKPPEVDDKLTSVNRLPVLCSPISGLPDMGSIDTGTKYQEHMGESVVAVNEELGKNYNKMLTYTQQLMRDTANPRWFETSSSETPILREEDIFKRGSIFRGAVGDNVTPLPTPPIPVELRTMQFDYQNMMQRGLFPWAVYGNVQQQMSYLAIANVAAAAMQVLTPYAESLRGLLSDLDNYWKDMIMVNKMRPNGMKLPENLPEKFRFDAQLDVEIPGYLVQRATVARMLDPKFRLPTEVVMDKLFPEVKDPIKAQAQVRRDDALNHPKAILADAIIAYKEQSAKMREVGDVVGAEVYDKLAASLESELVGTPYQSIAEPATQATPREVLPEREFTRPQGAGMEAI